MFKFFVHFPKSFVNKLLDNDIDTILVKKGSNTEASIILRF